MPKPEEGARAKEVTLIDAKAEEREERCLCRGRHRKKSERQGKCGAEGVGGQA